MAIHMDSLDYYYNDTNQGGCWGGGSATPYGFYEPSNMYMVNNATQIYQDLSGKGWSFNAIMAVLGNMSYESYINPAQSEIGKPTTGSYGYGLCQWTPCGTTVKQWLSQNGYPLTSGYYQLDYLDIDPNNKWDANKAGYSWYQFKHSNQSVAYLTQEFLRCYEKGLAHEYRYYCAHYYEQLFGGGLSGNPIYVTYEGNGYAYAYPSRVDFDEDFTLYATAFDSDRIDTITGTTESGQSIAMLISPQATYTYDNTYGNYITIHVVFTGTTPPIPPPPSYIKRKHMKIWMYPLFRKGNKVWQN